MPVVRLLERIICDLHARYHGYNAEIGSCMDLTRVAVNASLLKILFSGIIELSQEHRGSLDQYGSKALHGFSPWTILIRESQ